MIKQIPQEKKREMVTGLLLRNSFVGQRVSSRIAGKTNRQAIQNRSVNCAAKIWIYWREPLLSC